MLPQNHFWTVYEQRQEIQTKFSTSIVQAKEMFALYEAYATKRIKDYDRLLAKKKVSGASRANKIEALTLQIKSDNYSNLKNTAIDWIDKASGATVWNVFMLANIKTINKAVGEWNHQLTQMTKNTMSDEGKVDAFDSNSEVVSAVKSGLESLKSIYTVRKGTQPYCWLIMLLCYLMLLAPYLIQRRNTKSLYTLVGNKSGESNDYGSFTL